MRPIEFDKLIKWSFKECNSQGSIFGVKKEKFYKNKSGTNIEIFGKKKNSTKRPCCGPKSQISKNIITM